MTSHVFFFEEKLFRLLWRIWLLTKHPNRYRICFPIQVILPVLSCIYYILLLMLIEKEQYNGRFSWSKWHSSKCVLLMNNLVDQIFQSKAIRTWSNFSSNIFYMNKTCCFFIVACLLRNRSSQFNVCFPLKINRHLPDWSRVHIDLVQGLVIEYSLYTPSDIHL